MQRTEITGEREIAYGVTGQSRRRDIIHDWLFVIADNKLSVEVSEDVYDSCTPVRARRQRMQQRSSVSI